MFIYYFDKHSQIGLRFHFNVTESWISDILVSVMSNAVNGRTEYKPLMSNPHRNLCATYFRSKEVNQCIAVTEKSKKKPSTDETEKNMLLFLTFCVHLSSQHTMIRLRILKSVHDRNISCSVPMRWRINYRWTFQREKARWTTNSGKKRNCRFKIKT